MSSPITMRSTKAEIMAALEAQAATMQAGPSWQQVATKFSNAMVATGQEIILLVKDCHRAGRGVRSWYDQITRELAKPLLKP